MPGRHSIVREAEVLCKTYRSCLRRKAYLGIMPKRARQGDCIAVLRVGGILYVLRKVTGSGIVYELIDECYVHGLMDRETYEWPEYAENDVYIR